MFHFTLQRVPLRNGLETQSKVAKRIGGIKTGKTGRFVSYCPHTTIKIAMCSLEKAQWDLVFLFQVSFVNLFLMLFLGNRRRQLFKYVREFRIINAYTLDFILFYLFLLPHRRKWSVLGIG